MLLPPIPVGPYIGRYCGQNTPGRIISYTGILALTINTDSAIAKEGFSANFTVIERTVPEGELAYKEKISASWGLRGNRNSGRPVTQAKYVVGIKIKLQPIKNHSEEEFFGCIGGV